MTKAQLLIVDDERDILELVTITCTRMGIDTRSAQSLAQARQALERERFDLCLTDMRLPDGNGIDLVREIIDQHPDTPVAMLSAYGSMDTAIEAMKAGAFDFLAKPVDLKVLRSLIGSAVKLGSAEAEAAQVAGHRDLTGHSRVMHETRELIRKLSRNQAPVFITGESGTGKELAARLIHQQGPRRDQPFVPVNCGAIPSELIESELFGHRKGSFTGAINDKTGLFQVAHGGTLFLDEIADLPLPMQVKLLRAIQEKRVRPVGSEHEVEVNARIISASHRHLANEVQQGRFRQDLFYRINVIELAMPPLRARPEDIGPLTEEILAQIAADSGAPVHHLSPEALKALAAYPFPGNVRELQNILERATALAEHSTLEVADLRLSTAASATPAAHDALVQAAGPVPEAPQSIQAQLDEVERRTLLEALDAAAWEPTAAAQQLGISPRSLRYRMHRLDIST